MWNSSPLVFISAYPFVYNIVQNLSGEILYNRDFHTKNKIDPYLFHWGRIVFKERGPFIIYHICE